MRGGAGSAGRDAGRRELLRPAGPGAELAAAPMLATLSDRRDFGEGWLFERKLVAQIAFTEWTRDGMLRHPRYLGLREDKRPRHVVRERAAA
ncbi:hypothetical protein [Streptomyces sp. NPDC052107]|uniref:ATP dependent DNA ligase n=1 Tax=Streptomyces sp. NPDC052107 TaxID=3155632 RepID=UPI0034312217